MSKYYPIDGVGHLDSHADWGSTRQLLDLVALAADASAFPAQPDSQLPSPRLISQQLYGPEKYRANTVNYISQWVPAFAEFVLHDLYRPRAGTTWMNISAPLCDPVYDPHCQGTGQIAYRREAGNVIDADIQKCNDATTWLDLSMVYSADATRLAELRAGVNGTLRVSTSATGHDIPPYTPEGGFETGDLRAADNLAVFSLHTLFHLEHNRLARSLHAQNPSWSDDQLFAEARRWNIAVYQKVVFYEFLPKLLSHHLPEYTGPVADLNPNLDLAAVTALEAYIRSATPPTIPVVDEWRAPAGPGFYSIDDTGAVVTETLQYGVDRVVRGMMLQPAGAMDLHVVPELRNHAVDHVAIDIQAARDRGLPSYNAVRLELTKNGLPWMPPVTSFAEITTDPAMAARAAALYGNVTNLDLLVGAMMEPVGYGKYLLPHSFSVLLTLQFRRLRDADPLYFDAPGVFDEDELEWIEDRTICDIITDVTGVGWMPTMLFQYQSALSYDLYNSIPASQWTTFEPMERYQMRWIIQDDMWHVELVSQLGGWVGVGFGITMQGADVIYCQQNEDGSPSVLDNQVANEYDYVMAPLPDQFVGGRQDIESGYDVTKQEGILTCRFSRKLLTGDPLDHIITDTMTPMIFAHGASSHLGQHGINGRAQHVLNLFPTPPESELLSNATKIGVIASSTSAIAVYALILAVVALKSKSRIVIMSAPLLLVLTVVGLALLNAFAILSTVTQSADICACRLGAALAGFTLIVFPSAMKLYRYFRIFNYSMSKVVRIPNLVLFAGAVSVAVIDIVVVASLWGSGDIGLSTGIANKCEVSDSAMITLLVVLTVPAAVLIGALYLMVQLLSMEGITVAHIRADIKAEGLFLTAFVALAGVFALVLGLLAPWVRNVTITQLSAEFAILLSVIPPVGLCYMKVRSFQIWAEDAGTKAVRTKSTQQQTQNGSVKGAAAPTHQSHMSGTHVRATSAGIISSIRRSIASFGSRDDADSERTRLEKLRVELEGQFDSCQRDLNVQTSVATKTKQRLQTVKQQMLMVEEELDFLLKQNAVPAAAAQKMAVGVSTTMKSSDVEPPAEHAAAQL